MWAPFVARRLFTATIIFCFVFHPRYVVIAQSGSDLRKEPQPNEVDEFAIMRAAFESVILRSRTVSSEGRPVTVYPFTLNIPEICSDSQWQRVIKKFPELTQETFEDFRTRNVKAHRIGSERLQGLEKVVVPTDEDVRRLQDQQGNLATLPAFRKVFPNVGLVAVLSRPGIGRAGQQAVISIIVSDWSGARIIGWWGTYLMEKHDGNWKLVGPIESPLVQ